MIPDTVIIIVFASKPTADRRRWLALVVVCLAQGMNVLDSTIVNVALPKIQHDLHFSQASLAWVIDAYLISFGSFLLMAGRLGDLIGRKRVFLAGIALFTFSSAVCGLANDQAVLIAARFVQGLGGAVSSSVIVAIIVTEFRRPAERATAMSAFTFVAVGGGSIGLLAGGAITQSIDWHWIFFINVPIGIIALLLGSVLLDRDQGIGIGKGVDVLGSVLITVALMLIVYAIVKATDYGWASAHTLGFGGAGLALIGVFLALESWLRNPIMPLRILRVRTLIGSSVIRGLLASGMFAAFFIGALYLEHVLGYSALQTGLAFLPMTLTVGTLSLGITRRIVGRFGARRTVPPGLVTMIAGLLVLSQQGAHSAYFPGLFFAFMLMGLGAGTSFMPLLTIAMSEVPTGDAGLASGIVNVSMQIGAAIGLAALASLATERTRALATGGHSATSALIGGYHLAFIVGAACIAVGALIAPVALRPQQQAASEDDGSDALEATARDGEPEPQAALAAQ
jgi:EmrB/QacA subfamily drug resistance transporter